MKSNGRFRVLILITLLAVTVLVGVANKPAPVVHAENNGAAPTPFMGWSTWFFDGGNPTETNIEAQANVVASQLKSHGYNYILLDDHYYLNPGTTVDQFGRWVVNPGQFPNGLAAVASHVHSQGLKFGTYLTPGIPVAAVNQNTPIQGTSFHARDIALTSKFQNNFGGFGNVMYYIDYTKPGAQAYINSWANELASWGVDFLKIDAVGDFNSADVQAWSQALQQTGRPITFDLSNTLDRNNINFWRQFSNAWRIEGDVQCYASCPNKMVNWSTVSARFNDAPAWAPLAAPGGWNDLDSLNVADGPNIDGITNDERQTYMTLWAIEAAPLYAGDDLTHMDSFGLSLLTNDEVIAVDQRGKAAVPVSQGGSQQVWFTNNGNGSYTVALFNLGGSTANVTANWSNFGFGGTASVHDMWSHSNLGSFTNSFTATLNSHASRLLTVVPGSGVVPTPTPAPGNGFNPTAHYKLLDRNSGKALDVTGASTANGAQVIQWTDSGTANQQWNVVAVGNNIYKLVSVNSGKVLDVTGASTANGALVIQWTDDGTTNQQWNIVSVSSGVFKLTSVNSGKVLDVTGASTANGATVIQQSDSGASSQQWSIIQV